MGNLIQNIPVYKPQLPQPKSEGTVRVDMPIAARPVLDIKNPFPQTKVYTYLPAEPISPPVTTPQGVRPQAPTAKLVKENFFQAVGSTIKSYGDYAKYFYNAAFKGEGDDYSVGKINDLAIRTGSLGIAAVLASSKMFPFAKGMEFVGLGTWFASMAIWPQILGLPIKAKTGVDINQEYIDSYGRRKYVYEDNGYRPMDLYRHVDLNGKPLSEDEYYKKYDRDYVYLDKVGDKLGIPGDIKNRHEAIMNKMGQVAVQGKTLWMLTAGIMTPVVSSIVADAAQTPLKNYLEKARYDKASSKLQQMHNQVTQMINLPRKDLTKVMEGLKISIDPKVESKFESLLTDREALSPKQFKKLRKFLERQFFGTGFHDSLHEAMTVGIDMTEPKVTINEQLKQNIKKITADAFKEVIAKLPAESKAKLPQQILNYTGMSDEQIREMLINTWNEGKSQIGYNTTESLKQNVGMKALEPFLNIDPNNKQFIRKFNNSVRELINKKTNEYINAQRYFVIPKDKMREIFKFAYTNNQLQKRLKEFEAATIKNISESMTAINWEKVPKKYIQSLGFTKGELSVIATQDATTASKVISEKFMGIVKDPEKFKKVIQEMHKYSKTAISKEEKAVLQLIGTAQEPGTLIKVKELMEAVAKDNFNHEVKNVLSRHYNARVEEITRKLRNTIDSYVKPIKALDLFKDIKTEVKSILGANGDVFKDIIAKDKSEEYFRKGIANRFYPFHNMTYQQAKESLETYLKDAVLQKNDINNWTTKFETELPGARRGMKDSLHLVRSLADVIFRKLGADVSAIINDSEFVEKCNLNNDLMRARFLRIENELSKSYTTHRNAFYDEIKKLCYGEKNLFNYLKKVLDEKRFNLSTEDYNNCKKLLYDFLEDRHLVSGYNKQEAIDTAARLLDFGASNRAISQMTGKNVTDFFVNAAQEIRSRNKWSKLVYGLLIGTTALSAVTIALMGKKNYFNKDKYEKIEKAPQGAGK